MMRIPYMLGVSVLLLGCGDEGAHQAADQAFEQFMQRAHRLEDGRLVIDGDILVSDLEEARAYFDDGVGRTGEALHGSGDEEDDDFRLSIHRVGGVDSRWAFPDNTHLTYCVDTASFGADANTVLAALDRAAGSWAQGGQVYFERVTAAPCNNATNGVTFNVRLDPTAAFFGSAFFPPYPRANRELILGPGALTTASGGRDLEGILRHELGHALGFRHEHIWIVCTGEVPVTFDPVLGVNADARALTPYDVDSVMHYPQCRPSGTGGYRQTALDQKGSVSVYGLNAGLVKSTTPL